MHFSRQTVVLDQLCLKVSKKFDFSLSSLLFYVILLSVPMLYFLFIPLNSGVEVMYILMYLCLYIFIKCARLAKMIELIVCFGEISCWLLNLFLITVSHVLRIMEREKQLSILYQKQGRATQFSSKANRDKWLQREIDDLQKVLSSNLVQVKCCFSKLECHFVYYIIVFSKYFIWIEHEDLLIYLSW